MSASAPSKRKRRGGPRRRTGKKSTFGGVAPADHDTGCHTCKERHSRCDEKKPVCSNCERLNLECTPSDFIAPSAWNTTKLEETAEEPTSDTIGQEPQPFELEAPSSTWDIFRARISGYDVLPDDSPPDDMLTLLNLRTPLAPSLPPTKEPPVILTSETAFLLQSYLQNVATWMDLMDHTNTYQIQIPRLTLSSPLLFHCVCAFTAKFLSLSHSRRNFTTWEPVASHHYGESLQLLIHALNSPLYKHALSATILLSSYEIMSSIASEHHKRHLLGQIMLVRHQAISALSSCSIDRANFWIHVRHEIGFALAMERPVVIDPIEWGVEWEKNDGDDDVREDVQGNHLLWILARVLGLVFGEEGDRDSRTGRQKRVEFLAELEQWRSRQAESFIGIPYGDEDEDGFRKVFFTVTAAAAGTFWYHVTHILLYAEPTLQDEAYKPFIQDQAKRIGDIAISEFPDSLRVFASHGLYYAAKHMSGIARKARIWSIMNAVEAELGYCTRNMVKKLQAQVERESEGLVHG